MLKYKVQKPFFKCSDFTCLIPALRFMGLTFRLPMTEGVMPRMNGRVPQGWSNTRGRAW